MTVEMKLRCHLEYVVMPEGVPMNEAETDALCCNSTVGQRFDAYKRSRENIPLLLPEEDDGRVLRWVNAGRQPWGIIYLSTARESQTYEQAD